MTRIGVLYDRNSPTKLGGYCDPFVLVRLCDDLFFIHLHKAEALTGGAGKVFEAFTGWYLRVKKQVFTGIRRTNGLGVRPLHIYRLPNTRKNGQSNGPPTKKSDHDSAR
jgi:hypothetical protein